MLSSGDNERLDGIQEQKARCNSVVADGSASDLGITGAGDKEDGESNGAYRPLLRFKGVRSQALETKMEISSLLVPSKTSHSQGH